MDTDRLVELLEGVQKGKVSVDRALKQLNHLPYEDLGFAKVDHHRSLRQGFPEVVLGESKSVEAIAAIAKAMQKKGTNVLITRLSPEKMTKGN